MPTNSKFLVLMNTGSMDNYNSAIRDSHTHTHTHMDTEKTALPFI